MGEVPCWIRASSWSYAKLRKSLYGLKQAAADWYDLQHRRLMAFDPDLSRSKADPCFYYKVKDGNYFFVLVHVDDYAVAYSDQLYFDAWLAHFRGVPDTDEYLDIKLIGDVTHLLQMRITRVHNVMTLDQERQISVLAAEYGVLDCKSVLTPMSAHLDLQKGEDAPAATIPFRQLVGALLWIGRHTHPEIMQPVVYLAQFCTCYGRDHFLAALRILKYLCTVQGRKLTFRGGYEHPLPENQARLTIYSDSDWAMGSTDRKSYSGNTVFINGDLVGWYTHKQPIVATSSTEAEYVAVSDACKDGLSLYYFLGEFVQVLTPITIYMDNQGAMFMASNLVTNKRSKHIDLRYHMIRDYINKGIFRLEYISTDKNIADIMTKGLEKVKHRMFTKMLLQDTEG
mmetsp:Transcript_43485/g.81431  ORF Transcript_43485/g.81431 Transcript_43485/m.81431 type:complete len:398 (+) Transcript_43485:385-1578(+)